MTNLKEIAKSYVGTAHINGGNVKGAGLDCCTLITNIQEEIGYGKIQITFGYSGDWFCKRDCKEMILPYLEKYFVRVEDYEIGDVISYRWGRAEYAHLSMVIDYDLVIHCEADSGVEITEITNPIFYDKLGNSRISGIWRRKNEPI